MHHLTVWCNCDSKLCKLDVRSPVPKAHSRITCDCPHRKFVHTELEADALTTDSSTVIYELGTGRYTNNAGWQLSKRARVSTSVVAACGSRCCQCNRATWRVTNDILAGMAWQPTSTAGQTNKPTHKRRSIAFLDVALAMPLQLFLSQPIAAPDAWRHHYLRVTSSHSADLHTWASQTPYSLRDADCCVGRGATRDDGAMKREKDGWGLRRQIENGLPWHCIVQRRCHVLIAAEPAAAGTATYAYIRLCVLSKTWLRLDLVGSVQAPRCVLYETRTKRRPQYQPFIGGSWRL